MDNAQNSVLDFWFRELTPQDWFGAGETFDPIVRRRFGRLHEEAAAGTLDWWAATPLGRLALILLLDQFSRHIHRGAPLAFAQDPKAQDLTLDGIAQTMDLQLAFSQRHFFYMPLMHAEDARLQRASIAQFTKLKEFAEQALEYAQGHSAQIERFGRFPARNIALSRPSSPDEEAFLAQAEDKAADSAGDTLDSRP